MPKARNPAVSTLDLLDGALTCFATHGLQATSIEELTTALNVSTRALYQKLGNKATILEAVYAYATAQLLVGQPETVLAGEKLHDYLGRWWQQTATAAQADPRAFRYWQLYRISPHIAAAQEPVLGPFATLPELLSQLLAQSDVKQSADALPRPVLSRWWAAQWTAAVEVVLTDPTCQARPEVGQRLLKQAYASWWQSLGVATTVLAAKMPPKPGWWDLVVQGAADHFTAKSAPTGLAALQRELKQGPA
jgi:AcrR family transcriptional regulator